MHTMYDEEEVPNMKRMCVVEEEVSLLSYSVFMPKLSTHRMHDTGSIVPHIQAKVFTDNQMS
jgi:hypothetical protein